MFFFRNTPFLKSFGCVRMPPPHDFSPVCNSITFFLFYVESHTIFFLSFLVYFNLGLLFSTIAFFFYYFILYILLYPPMIDYHPPPPPLSYLYRCHQLLTSTQKYYCYKLSIWSVQISVLLWSSYPLVLKNNGESWILLPLPPLSNLVIYKVF